MWLLVFSNSIRVSRKLRGFFWGYEGSGWFGVGLVVELAFGGICGLMMWFSSLCCLESQT